MMLTFPGISCYFSAGAYALGSGLDATDLPSISVNAFFDHLGIGDHTHFWLLYLLINRTNGFQCTYFSVQNYARDDFHSDCNWCC